MNPENPPLLDENPSKKNITDSEENKTDITFLMYHSDTPLYSLGFSNRKTSNLTVAIGSHLPTNKNSIMILEVPANKQEINRTKIIPQPYPSTMIKFHPKPDVL